MSFPFANRMSRTTKSFVREILKVTDRPDMISFAGGLPNPNLMPVRELAAAADKVLSTDGRAALQYRSTEGYLPLRQWIASRYASQGLRVSPDNILITTGSQQALDLLGKILLDDGDSVILEQPTYVAAIQAFSLYGASFRSIPINDDGIDLVTLSSTPTLPRAKLVYCMPNFQNPTGITYSAPCRAGLAETLRDTSALLIEDDPYGDLRFRGQPLLPLATYRPDRTAILGSFSKTVAPGLRLGWVAAPTEVIEKLTIAKQAADLHTDQLSQRILHQYLTDNDFDAHLAQLRPAYRAQCDAMLEALGDYLPDLHTTRPDGGMFLFATLPEGTSSTQLFDLAIQHNVAFVPGPAFHPNATGDNTLRLNFSNSTPTQIRTGIQRLAASLEDLRSLTQSTVPDSILA